MSGPTPDLALFNLAIDSKLRASDLVHLKIEDICSGRLVRDRGVVTQQKTGRPMQFEITEVTRQSVERLLVSQPDDGGDYLFRSRTLGRPPHLGQAISVVFAAMCWMDDVEAEEGEVVAILHHRNAADAHRA